MPISLRAGVILGFAVAAWTVVMGITHPHATPARPAESNLLSVIFQTRDHGRAFGLTLSEKLVGGGWGLLIVLCVIAGCSPTGAQIVQRVNGDDWSLPAWVQMTPNAGLISWATPDKGHGDWLNRMAAAPRFQDGAVHLAGICYVKWADVNPAEDVYNWSAVDEVIQRYCSQPGAGFTLWLANYNREVVPTWLMAKPGMSVLADGTIPSWRTDCPYQKYLKKLLQALAARYRDNPRFLALEMRGLDRDWGEMYYHGDLKDARDHHGFTPEAFKAWCIRYIDDGLEAFPGQAHKLIWLRQGGPDSPNYFHATLFPEYRQASIDVTRYAYAKGLGRRDGGVEVWTWYTWNAELYGQRVTPDGYLETVEDFPALQDGRMWYTENEMLENCPYLWPNSESYRVWPILCLRALEFRCNWVWLDSNFYDRYDRDRPGLNRWFELSLGKTCRTSPDGWSWMREGYVWGHDGQRWGLHTVRNFERWVLQRNVPPDGNTVPDEWLDVTGWGQWIREWYFGKKGGEYHACRTDVASGNTCVYFRTWRGFLDGGPHGLLVKVTYRDGPATTWRLEYSTGHDVAATPEVSTVDSGQWKTITFSVPDMHLDGRFAGGMDFRIVNRGRKDLTVRFLRLVKRRAPGDDR